MDFFGYQEDGSCAAKTLSSETPPKMNRLLLAAVLLAGTALASPASAAVLNNLTITALPAGLTVPQSLSNPCIICGTSAGGNQPANFGYNDFTSTGNLTSFNTFSTNIIGGGPLPGNLEVNALPYNGTLLQAFTDAGGTFGVVIDVNTANGGETLTAFQLIDLDLPIGDRVIFDFTGSLALPDINNGNGKGDYLISGFNLSPYIGDRLIFRAAWQGASDGAESFYIVPLAAVPAPAALPLFASGLVGLGLLFSRRKKKTVDVATA